MSILEVFKKTKTKETDAKTQKAVKVKKVKQASKKVESKDTAKDKAVATSKIKVAPKATLSKGDAHRIIVKPLVTEKATDMSALNQYTFEVAIRSNKIEIKKAIRALYHVDPKKIRIINKPGKLIRRGRHTGVTKKWKKAIVSLKAGDKIEFFSGV